MKTRSVFVLALVAMLCAWPVSGQEQVGSVAGQVTDTEGGVLPGATVELSGPGIGTLVSTTDERGNYRFPRVPPGVYTVSVQLEGFQPAEATGASVTLGKTTSVRFELEVGEFTEEILVTGERAQIDTHQSATAVSIAREQLELIPRGRDFADVVTQAPGANRESFLGGLSIDGASGAENRFVIDGVETTNPDSGQQGQTLRVDFIEEVQVQSAGYDAEYGGAVGGVINVITKSGTNEFHGTVGVDYEDSSWEGDERPTPRNDAAEVCGSDNFLCTFDKDDRTQLEPAFSLGGPIARDNAWFFVGYQNSTEEIDRAPVGSSRTFSEETTRQYFVGNIKGNVGSQFLYRVGMNLSPREEEGVLPARDGSTPDAADLGVTTDFPNENYSAYADYVPSNNFYLTGRVGYYSRNQEDSGLDATEQFFFDDTNPGDVGLPTTDPRHRPTDFNSAPTFVNTVEDKWDRQEASLAGNLFVRGAGDHAFKAGVQYAELENNVLVTENGNFFRLIWGDSDRFGAGVQGDLGSIEVRRFETVGDGITSENLGLFLQDEWSVLPNLTLNLGVRAEQEKIPNYPVNQPLYGDYAIEFDFDDKIAPRVGFAWDVLSDQRWKLYGSYGTYYDITKLAMPRGSFGGDRWISYLYPLNTFDWQSLSDGCHVSTNDINDNPCPLLGDPVALDLRAPSNPADLIDPDLKPMEQREIQLGLDHQLSPNIVVGARYVNKELQETIEDIGFLECVGAICQETFITGNPGKGVVGGDPPGPAPPQPEAVRDYEAVTLRLERRFVDNWSLRASYTYSELEGNYSGLASSDEFGRSDPNVERSFDALHNAYDQNGNQVIGPLNTDRPNQVEIQGIYRTPWGTVLGLNQYWAEGTPISEQVSYIGVPFFPNGRENVGRMDDFTQTDLQITHPFEIGGYELELAVNVLNLFDEDTVVRVDNNHYNTDLCGVINCDRSDAQNDLFSRTPIDVNAIMDAAVARGDAVVNPLYLRPFGDATAPAFQDPREVRVSATFRF